MKEGKEMKVKWLQISDMHITESSSWDVMKTKYYEFLKKEKLSFIIITGDLHNYSDDSYSSTLDFLQELVTTLGIKKTNVYIMPGNQDVDKSLSTNIEDAVAKVCSETKTNPDFYEKRTKQLVNRFNNYKSFLKCFYGEDEAKNFLSVVNGYFRFTYDKLLHLICVNSAFVSDGERSHAEIVPIHDLTKIKNTDKLPTIICTHHHPEDLFQSQYKILNSVVQSLSISAHLCGDRHQAQTGDRTQSYPNKYSCPVFCGPKGTVEHSDFFSDIGFIIYEWDLNTNNVEVRYISWYNQINDFDKDLRLRDIRFRMKCERAQSPLTETATTKREREKKKPPSSESMIWLPDAEKGVGNQVRFESYSAVGAAKQFISDKDPSQDICWGISSVKGAGKTFLLQVKRVKLSQKNYFTLPFVKKPGPNNNWATESIVKPFPLSKLYGSSMKELTALWEYSIVVHVIQSFLYFLNTKQKNKDYIKSILEAIDRKKLSQATLSIFDKPYLVSLDKVLKKVLAESNWGHLALSELPVLHETLNTATEILSKYFRKDGFALFIDKLDQNIDPPVPDGPPSCATCEYQDVVINCKNEKKDHSFCTKEHNEECSDLCCYHCPTFSDEHAGTKDRVPVTSVYFPYVNYWQYFQLALMNAADTIFQSYSGCIKVYFTIREEAFNVNDNLFYDRRAKIDKICARIHYSKDEQKTIFFDSIREEKNPAMLFSPDEANNNPEFALVGIDKLCHHYVKDSSESLFDCLYRHSFDRARDIQEYGKTFAKNMSEIRLIQDYDDRAEHIKRKIEETASRLLLSVSESCYYEEKILFMPRFWRDRDHFISLLKMIDRNLLFPKDMVNICQFFNKIDSDETVDSCYRNGCNNPQCEIHPFSLLYNIGLLGIIRLHNHKVVIQEFRDSSEISYFRAENNLYVGDDSCYVLHPALTKAIESIKKHNIYHFNRFIIGKGLSAPTAIVKTMILDKNKLSPEAFLENYYSREPIQLI